jgi:hypothetical protein
VYNGTASDFLAWVNANRVGTGQLWDPVRLGADDFLLPGVVHFLDSAFTDVPGTAPGSVQSAFFAGLQQYGIHPGPGQTRPGTFPPILLGTVRTFAEKWSERFPGPGVYNPSEPACPCPVYAVGPARAETGGAGSETRGRLALPVSMPLLVRLVRGSSGANQPVSDRVDLTAYAPPVVSFSRDLQTIDQAARRLLEEGVAGTVPFEAAMWLHQVTLLYLCLLHNGSTALADAGKANFRTCFDVVTPMDGNRFEYRQQTLRAGLRDVLNVLGQPVPANALGTDRFAVLLKTDGSTALEILSRSGQDLAARTVPTPWFNQVRL